MTSEHRKSVRRKYTPVKDRKKNPNAWRPLMPRVMAKVATDKNGCWVWQGYTTDRGYASIMWNGEQWLVHRAVYTELIGPIPDGLVLDHLCENPSCANPMHLEAVTQYDNLARSHGFIQMHGMQTHCKYGHEFTPENTDLRPQSMGRPGFARFCKQCKAESWQRQKARKSAND